MLKNGRFFVALGKLLRSVRKDRLIEAEKTRLNCKLQAAASGAKIGRGQDSGFADLHKLAHTKCLRYCSLGMPEPLFSSRENRGSLPDCVFFQTPCKSGLRGPAGEQPRRAGN